MIGIGVEFKMADGHLEGNGGKRKERATTVLGRKRAAHEKM